MLLGSPAEPYTKLGTATIAYSPNIWSGECAKRTNTGYGYRRSWRPWRGYPRDTQGSGRDMPLDGTQILSKGVVHGLGIPLNVSEFWGGK
jgi:hypothetical protein